MPSLKIFIKNNSVLFLLTVLLATVFLNRLIFVIMVPIWHTPDEQAHFAQVAYFGEFNTFPQNQPLDLNREILESERILGTERDEHGDNKFTFHPEYKIERSNSLTGKYESQIRSLPKEFRQLLVKQEAANYPPLYYWVAAIPYKIFYNSDLITRVYLARFMSILMSVGTVYFGFLISKLVFPKSMIKQISLSLIFAFQPMFSFVSSGVSSDNLMNLLFTVLIYLSLSIIKFGFKKKSLLYVGIIFILLYLTKPQFILGVPIFSTAIFLWFIKNEMISKSKKIVFSVLLVFLLLVFFLLLFFGNTGQFLKVVPFLMSYYPVHSGESVNGFLVFFKSTLIHTAREVIPWYWGVYDWLGVTYPIQVIRALNRLMILSGIGLIVYVIRLKRQKSKFIHQTDPLIVLFLGLVGLIYFLGITFYNYLFTLGHGFPFGIQGRYYFPTMISHMSLILVGLLALVPQRFSNLLAKMLGLIMIIFNCFALWLIANIYYDLSSWEMFIAQASQYKPDVFKGVNLQLTLLLYLVTLILFLANFLKLRDSKS